MRQCNGTRHIFSWDGLDEWINSRRLRRHVLRIWMCRPENSQAKSVHFGGFRNLNPETQGRCIHRILLVFWVCNPCSMIGSPTAVRISTLSTQFRRYVLPKLCIRSSVQYLKLHWVCPEKINLNFYVMHTFSSPLPSSASTRTKPEDRGSNSLEVLKQIYHSTRRANRKSKHYVGYHWPWKPANFTQVMKSIFGRITTVP
jgi:hypothetical protein